MIIAIDIGTTSITVLAFDALSRCVLVSATADNASDIFGLPTGHHEQCPHKIWKVVLGLMDSVFADLKVKHGNESSRRVAGVIVTGQMHGILLLDTELEPVTNLITWRDQRSIECPKVIAINQNQGVIDRCGCTLNAGYGAASLCTLLEDSAFRDRVLAEKIVAVSIVDFVTARLSGRIKTDPSLAASWGVLDISSGCWDQPALSFLDIPQQLLPEIEPSGAPVGSLLSEFKNRWSLQVDVPICAGLGDNQASVLASAPLQSGVCVVNIGTGAQVSMIGEGFSYKPGLEVRPLVNSAYMRVGSALCGGWAYSYLAGFFRETVKQFAGIEINFNDLLNRMNELGMLSSADAGGIAADTRFLKMGPDVGSEGGFSNIDSSNLIPGNLCRATANGIVEELYQLYLRFEQDASSLYIAGNGVRYNAMLRAEIAVKWGLDPVVSAATEEAALGAAYLAAMNLGYIEGSLEQAPRFVMIEKA